MVKGTDCSSRGARFDSYNPHGSSHLSNFSSWGPDTLPQTETQAKHHCMEHRNKLLIILWFHVPDIEVTSSGWFLCSSRYPQLSWCGIFKLIRWLYLDIWHSGTGSWKSAVSVSLTCSGGSSELLRGLKLQDCWLYGCSNPNILFLSHSSEQVGRSSHPRLKGKGIPGYEGKVKDFSVMLFILTTALGGRYFLFPFYSRINFICLTADSQCNAHHMVSNQS